MSEMDPGLTRQLEQLLKRQALIDKLEAVLTRAFGEVEIRVLEDGETWEQARDRSLRQRLQSIWPKRSARSWYRR